MTSAAPAIAQGFLSALGSPLFFTTNTIDKGGPNKVGPNQWNIVDRKKASHEGFSYSSAMQAKGEASAGAIADAFLAAIKQRQDRGQILHVGISEVSIDEIERARRVVPIAAVQNHYNLSERGHEAVVDYCERENIVFVPFFPLRGNGGRAVAEIAARHGATPAQIALAWLLRRSPIMLPIPGTLSLEHLKENLAALQIDLTAAEFDALR